MSLSRFAWLGATGFLLNGNWEWLQTPFFVDSTDSLNEIVWFRFHCTLGDVLILWSSAASVTAMRRTTRWIVTPRGPELVCLTLLGVVYTAFSESFNIARGSWGYSDLMPVVPGTSVGIVPLAQWLLLPSVSVLLASRLARRGEP